MRINFSQGDEEPTTDINMDMAFALQYGLALSVLRDDGVGARFMLTFAGSTGFTDLDLEGIMSLDMSAVMEELASKTAVLTAYDDAGEVINTQNVGLDDLPGLGELLGGIKAKDDPAPPMSVR